MMVAMSRFIEKLKHAFALDPDPDERRELPSSLERLAQIIVRRRLELPAMIVLETATPLNFLASQTASALVPILSPFMAVDDLQEAAVALEDRKMFRRLADRIELLSQELGGTQ